MSTLLTSTANRELLASLSEDQRTRIRARLAAIRKVEAAPKGTKNKVMTRLSDELGITIGGLSSLCALYRRDGLKGIVPRASARPSAAV